MISVSQVQRGFVSFVDNEVAAAFDGWQKIVVGGVAGLLAANLPNVIKEYAAHPIVAALGVYDSNSNAVNIDALYNAFVPKMELEKIPITIPKIGTIRFGRDEIDSLVRYIKEA
jgi:hypothetical protein